MPPSQPTISPSQARRIALAAQGFGEERPTGRIDARHIRRVIGRVQILQIDSVNVLSRSHYLPIFSRLGPYPRSLLDRMSWGGRHRELFEYWAHEASLLPLRLQPLMRWRMDRVEDAWGSIRRIETERPGFLDEIRALVASRGPIGGGDVDVERPVRTPGAMWNWHDGKRALEWLFFAGEVTTASRPNFERRYDLTDRVLPPEVLTAATPEPEDARRELIRLAARSLGVATETDLRDYFRLRPDESRAAVAELVDAGELLPVRIAGWASPGYLHPEARVPRWIRTAALLSPFDSLIWERPRTQRLFGFRYRLEIYTPAPKRVYGYYVLPFLLDDALVARVDLKADRVAGALLVRGAYAEPGHDRGRVADALAGQLRSLAGWLELDTVSVDERGDLAAALRAALGRSPMP